MAQRLYDFFWSDYCDWFIEAAKTEIFSEDEARKKSVLAVMDFVLVWVSATASSVHAPYHGRTLVGVWIRRARGELDPVRCAAAGRVVID